MRHIAPLRRCASLLLVCSSLAAGRARAQATILVDPLEPVYGDIDRLAAAGLLDRTLIGQRPFSRRRVALLVVRAESTVVRANGPAPVERAVLLRLHSEYAWEIAQLGKAKGERRADRVAADLDSSTAGIDSERSWELAPVRAASVDLTASSSATRAIPRTNGLGEIDASINPLLANRHGEPLVRGENLLVQTTHSLQSPHLAIGFSPQLYLQAAGGTSTRALGNVQELYLRALYRNLALEVGREYQLWGQGRDVGLLSSNNSPALDLVRLSSDVPFRLPWVFRHLGPTMLSLFYADLGAKQNFPHPYFVGYKASIAPASWLELGGTVYTKAGGQGGPRTTFAKRIGDVFPFLEANFFGNRFGAKGNFNFSDRYAGLDTRIHIPAAGGAVLYTELLLNDFDIRRVSSVLWEDAGHVAGLELPCLADDGRLGLTLEYHHTGIRYYEHDQYLSGQTLRGVLIGDPLGPDAQGGYTTIDWARSARQRLTIDAAAERRSNDQYALRPEPAFGFRRIEARPKEWRYRVTATWRTLPEHGRAGLLVQAGYEHVTNFDFDTALVRNGVLGRVAFEVPFR